MDNPRPEKVAVVTEVRERLGSASGAILTEYRGLTVSEIARLRRSLREVGGEYKVYKNTLVRFAVRDLGLDELEALLTGPTAIAFVDGDAAAVAKALRDFSRGNPNLVVKGGLLGGNVLDAARTGALAELPSREVLLSRLAGGLAAPMQQLAGLLQALPRNLAYGLKALLDQGGAPGQDGTAAGGAGAPAVAEEAGDGAPAGQDGTAAGGAGAPAVAEEAEAAAPRVDEVSDAPATPEADEAPAAPAEPEPGEPSPVTDVSPDSDNQSEQ